MLSRLLQKKAVPPLSYAVSSGDGREKGALHVFGKRTLRTRGPVGGPIGSILTLEDVSRVFESHAR